MEKREILLKPFFQKLFDYLESKGVELDDLEIDKDNLEEYSYNDIHEQAKNLSTGNIKHLLAGINVYMNLPDPDSNFVREEEVDETSFKKAKHYPNEKANLLGARDFIHSYDENCIISLNVLNDLFEKISIEGLLDEFQYSNYNNVWKPITTYLIVAGKSNPDKLEECIKAIDNEENEGFLLAKSKDVSNKSLISFLYTDYLLKGNKITLNEKLKYSGSSTNYSLETITENIPYEQYLEFSDIINELNHSNDILTRFLKLYHLLEYLTYRHRLKPIVDQSSTNKSFIRNIMSLNQNTKELDNLIIFMNKEFTNEIEAGQFDIPTTLELRNELKKFWLGAREWNHIVPKRIATLIYGIRNAIVHNKESEFHLTYINAKNYPEIMDFINAFIPKLEEMILGKVFEENGPFQYTAKEIKMY